MIIGTTARFKFKLPYSRNELEWATMSFWQPSNPNPLLPIIKTMDHCESSDDPTELYVSLTAEETLRFSEEYKVMVQIRAKHILTGTIFGSRPKLFTIYPMNDDILEDVPISPDNPLPPEDEDGFIIIDGGIVTAE